MAFRLYSKSHAGAMSRFIDRTRLFQAQERVDRVRRVSLSEFGSRYMSWRRLPAATTLTSEWFRLRLHYRAGFLGAMDRSLDVDLFERPGLLETGERLKLWRERIRKVRVMVFCLPIWAAFPGARLGGIDQEIRNIFLEDFERVLVSYEELRRRTQSQPVKAILVLTMADDSRSALTTLYERWIAPYMESPHTYLRVLRSGSGVTQYLAEARRVSAALLKELSASPDPRVSSIPQVLDFGARPWVIPTSAIDGSRLDRIEKEYGTSSDRPERPAPVPVHVELPLLVALCERTNALM